MRVSPDLHPQRSQWWNKPIGEQDETASFAVFPNVFMNINIVKDPRQRWHVHEAIYALKLKLRVTEALTTLKNTTYLLINNMRTT